MDIEWPVGYGPIKCLSEFSNNNRPIGTSWVVKCFAHERSRQITSQIGTLETRVKVLKNFLNNLQRVIDQYEAGYEDEDQVTEEDYELCLKDFEEKELEMGNVEEQLTRLRSEQEEILAKIEGSKPWRDTEEVAGKRLEMETAKPDEIVDDGVLEQVKKTLNAYLPEEYQKFSVFAEYLGSGGDAEGGAAGKSRETGAEADDDKGIGEASATKVETSVIHLDPSMRTAGKIVTTALGARVREEDTWDVFHVLSPLPIVTYGIEGGERAITNVANVTRDPQGCDDMLRDGRRIMDAIGAYIQKSHRGNFTMAHLLPVTSCVRLTRSQEGYQDEYCVGLVSPYCLNGSIQRWLSTIRGSDRHFFDTDFLLSNFRGLLDALHTLYRKNKVVHGNVKPSNMFVSHDGASLVLGGFIPECQLFRLFAMRRHHPIFTSPELYKLVKVAYETTEITMDEDFFKQNIDLHKHDLFCMGLCLYFVLTRNPPDKKMHRSKAFHRARVNEFATGNEELTDLVRSLLAWNPEDRSIIGVDAGSVRERFETLLGWRAKK